MKKLSSNDKLAIGLALGLIFGTGTMSRKSAS